MLIPNLPLPFFFPPNYKRRIYPAPAVTWRKPLSCERVRVNWEHPLNKDLVFACLPHYPIALDLVSGIAALPSAATTSADFSQDGDAIKSNETTGGTWTFNSFIGPDAINGPYSWMSIGKIYGDGRGVTLFRDGEPGNGYGFAGALDDIAVYTNSMLSKVDNSASVGPGNTFLGTGMELRWHRIGVTADGTNHTFFTLGKVSAPVAKAGYPTANSARRMTLCGTYAGPATGCGLGLLYVWSRCLSVNEMREVITHPYGTPSNPRLIYEPRPIYFTKQIDVQGTYHRYPMLNY